MLVAMADLQAGSTHERKTALGGLQGLCTMVVTAALQQQHVAWAGSPCPPFVPFQAGSYWQ